MTPSPQHSDWSATPPYPRRFSWKMRFFLTFFLFAMAFRCFAVLFPMDEWRYAYGIEELPRPFPTPAERAALAASATPDNPHPEWSAYLLTADSVRSFWRPWPDSESREYLESPLDTVKWAACWLDSRLEFLEHLIAVNERWVLYAPTVYQVIPHTRARLYYSDGSEIVLRQWTEPKDYTHYGHWFEERIGNYEYLVVIGAPRQCQGYCNLLAHRHAHNAKGADLVRIVLFYVDVILAPPNVDAMAHYKEQNRLTATPPRLPGTFRTDHRACSWQVKPDFYEFDVENMEGWLLNSGSQ